MMDCRVQIIKEEGENGLLDFVLGVRISLN